MGATKANEDKKMSEARFTKGLWSIGYDNDSSCEWYYNGPAKVEYSYNSTGNEEIEALANANLIAAATKMYKKLDEISDYLLEIGGLANNRKAREIENLLKEARGEK